MQLFQSTFVLGPYLAALGSYSWLSTQGSLLVVFGEPCDDGDQIACFIPLNYLSGPNVTFYCAFLRLYWIDQKWKILRSINWDFFPVTLHPLGTSYMFMYFHVSFGGILGHTFIFSPCRGSTIWTMPSCVKGLLLPLCSGITFDHAVGPICGAGDQSYLWSLHSPPPD